MSSSALSLDATDCLYRFAHRDCFKSDGTLNSGIFSLRRPGVSVGLAKLIPDNLFEKFCSIKPEQGVARITVGDVTACEMGVEAQRATDWGDFSDAHAILTGYSEWTNKRKTDAEKRLRDAANKGILKRPLGLK